MIAAIAFSFNIVAGFLSGDDLTTCCCCCNCLLFKSDELVEVTELFNLLLLVMLFAVAFVFFDIK